MIEVISIGSDNIVRLDALTNASSGAYINNATVTYALFDSTGCRKMVSVHFSDHRKMN